ncbi:hypothetical protein C0Q70_14855 [Pomacea canaliculata]|uniref:EGF-like domain-containing protein n=1 Tax=Pomacea canaliculata TaxID=400727 RepID=A0A2T7NT88_POMCA|nr:hypothetical protein C0Q70_14855 [Pomacea canaliculata]
MKFVLLVCLVLTVTQAVKYHKSKLQFAQKRSLMTKRQGIRCVEYEFMCASGECIPSDWACDTEADCEDGSDEMECECTCTGENKFQCKNRKCIPHSFVCDTQNDCGDHTDEVYCQCNPTIHFQCAHGGCVLLKWRCDNNDDCGDFSDELGCREYSGWSEDACRDDKGHSSC